MVCLGIPTLARRCLSLTFDRINLGVYNCHRLSLFRRKIWGMHTRLQTLWLPLAGSKHHWSIDELQRVGMFLPRSHKTDLHNF